METFNKNFYFDHQIDLNRTPFEASKCVFQKKTILKCRKIDRQAHFFTEVWSIIYNMNT